jgi:hypothetical protein
METNPFKQPDVIAANEEGMAALSNLLDASGTEKEKEALLRIKAANKEMDRINRKLRGHLRELKQR